MSSMITARDIVASITAQNAFLGRSRSPRIRFQETDAQFFTLTGNVLTRNATVATVGKSAYTITIASTGSFGTNNQREVTITVNEAGSVANFITTWRTTTANESITIPTTGRGLITRFTGAMAVARTERQAMLPIPMPAQVIIPSASVVSSRGFTSSTSEPIEQKYRRLRSGET